MCCVNINHDARTRLFWRFIAVVLARAWTSKKTNPTPLSQITCHVVVSLIRDSPLRYHSGARIPQFIVEMQVSKNFTRCKRSHLTPPIEFNVFRISPVCLQAGAGMQKSSQKGSKVYLLRVIKSGTRHLARTGPIGDSENLFARRVPKSSFSGM